MFKILIDFLVGHLIYYFFNIKVLEKEYPLICVPRYFLPLGFNKV